MGGCCCSSKKTRLHGTPVYYYCPPALEDNESLMSHDGADSALTAGLLVDMDMEASLPDTYLAPPVPLPFDVLLGIPESTDSDPVKETPSGSNSNTSATCKDIDKTKCEEHESLSPVSQKNLEHTKIDEPNIIALEEDDACPICFEEYDTENPKIITKCEHHFHLSCILEWMERSDMCPICGQEAEFDHNIC